VDWAAGAAGSVPFAVRQAFGGRDQVTGLGGAVRGVDSGAYGTNLKAVNNLDLRLTLPAIVLRDLVPGVVLFWDAGYWARVGEGLAPAPSGFVSSVGGGVSLDLFDIATLVVYVDWRLDAPNADGEQLKLGAIEFGYHF
jgi:hypothetical protein